MCKDIFLLIRFVVNVAVGFLLAALSLLMFVVKHWQIILFAAYFSYFFMSTGASMDAIYTSAEEGAISTSDFINNNFIAPYNQFISCITLTRHIYNQNLALIQAILRELASTVGIYVFRSDIPPDARSIVSDLCGFVEYVFTFVKSFIEIFGDFIEELFDFLDQFVTTLLDQDFIHIFVEIIQNVLLEFFGPAQCFLPVSQINQRFFGCLCTPVYDSYTDVPTNPFNALGGCLCGRSFDITGDFLNDVIYPCFRIDLIQSYASTVQSITSEAYQTSNTIIEKTKNINQTISIINGLIGKIEDGIGDLLDDICDILGCRPGPNGSMYVRDENGVEFLINPKSPPPSYDEFNQRFYEMYSVYRRAAATHPPPIEPLFEMPPYEILPPVEPPRPQTPFKMRNLSFPTEHHEIAYRGARNLMAVVKQVYRDRDANGFIPAAEIQQRFRDSGLDFGEFSGAVIRASRGEDWKPVCAIRSREEILRAIPQPEYSPRIVIILAGVLAGTAACACVAVGSCIATTVCGVCFSGVIILLIPLFPPIMSIFLTAGNDFFYIITAGHPQDQFSQDYVSDWVTTLAPYIENTLYTGFAPINFENMFSAFGSLFILQSEYTITALLRQFMCAFPQFGNCPPRPLHFDTPQDYIFGLLQCEEGSPCSTVNDCRSRTGQSARAKSCNCAGRAADFWAPCNGTTPGVCHCWPYADETKAVEPINVTVIMAPECEALGWNYRQIMPFQGVSFGTMVYNWLKTALRTFRLATNSYSTGLSVPWVLLFVVLFLTICRCTRKMAKRLAVFIVLTNILSIYTPTVADSLDRISGQWPLSYFESTIYDYTHFPNATPGNRGSISYAEAQCTIMTLAQTAVITEITIAVVLALLSLLEHGVINLLLLGAWTLVKGCLSRACWCCGWRE